MILDVIRSVHDVASFKTDYIKVDEIDDTLISAPIFYSKDNAAYDLYVQKNKMD